MKKIKSTASTKKSPLVVKGFIKAVNKAVVDSNCKPIRKKK